MKSIESRMTRSLKTLQDTLSSAESTFRNLVIHYAVALTLPEPLRMGVSGEIGVQIANGMGVKGIEAGSEMALPFFVFTFLPVIVRSQNDSGLKIRKY